MTANQINFAKAKEEARHNLAQEQLTQEQNKLTKENIKAQKAHYESSDAYTDSHYQRADAASMTSANAQAMNAVTSRKQYEMAYDIEYGWTGNIGYPEGMPLTAQQKNVELVYRTSEYDPYMRKKEAEANTAEAETEHVKASTEKVRTDTDTSKTQALNNVLNAIFGRKGLYGIWDTTVTKP